MIAAAATAVVIIGGITAAVVTANRENASATDAQSRQESLQDSDGETDTGNPQTGSHEETDQENAQAAAGADTNQENPQAAADAVTNQEDQQASSDTDELTFWLHRADWGEEKDLTGITLFNGECTAPIHMEDFDGDEHLGPYCIGYFRYDDNLRDVVSSPNLTELFTDDRIYRNKELAIDLQTACDEEGHFVQMHSSDDDCAVWHIYMCNYTDEILSFRQIYENNWFFIEADSLAILEWGMFKGSSRDQNADYHIIQATLEAIIDTYGRPSYLISCGDSFLENYEKNLDDIEYILVWEREDFVISLNLMEAIFTDTGHYANALETIRNTGAEYGMYLDTLGDLVYITREAWDNGYKEYYYPEEGYGADYDTHVYYDLDDLK